MDPRKSSKMDPFGQYMGNIPSASRPSLRERHRPAAPGGSATGAPTAELTLAGVGGGK
jgi:hypothetical protein